MTLLFAGDPHRDFSPIARACLAHKPGDLILVGDLDCPRPLTTLLSEIISAGWRIHWILGNHDCETEAAFDNLAGDHPDGDLGYRVAEIGGFRVAGLPGVFKPSVWSPRADDDSGRIDPPRFLDRGSFIAAQPKARLWRGGLPLWHRDTIFPDDVAQLATRRFDILVSHEAPSCHRHGFEAIDALAAAGGARLIVHGHHHESYTATLPDGTTVRGLGLAEPWVFPGGGY